MAVFIGFGWWFAKGKRMTKRERMRALHYARCRRHRMPLVVRAVDDRLGDWADPFAPPVPGVVVRCLHCGREFSSDLMQWVVMEETGEGYWCCATPGCEGVGVGFDLWACHEVGAWLPG